MSYTYPIDAQLMFDDRTHQFVGFGLSLADVNGVRAAVDDMWRNAPGGWSYEFSRLASRYAGAGQHRVAALAYGCAKFPCLADEGRVTAFRHQLAEYQQAAPGFGVRFERRVLPLPYRGDTVSVPVHIFSTVKEYPQRPVLMISGGVDTFKMDIHAWCVAFAQHADVTVLAFDLPGTGETTTPLSVEADEVVLGLVAAARSLGDGRVAHLGISFGGNLSAMTGLTSSVDASIVLGGPVLDAFAADWASRVPYGMVDIVGNALGFDSQPSVEKVLAAAAPLGRRELFQGPSNSPMLVINGADDYFVPQSATLAFQGRPGTEVHLIPGTGHCAMSKAAEVVPQMIGWLRTRFDGNKAGSRP